MKCGRQPIWLLGYSLVACASPPPPAPPPAPAATPTPAAAVEPDREADKSWAAEQPRRLDDLPWTAEAPAVLAADELLRRERGVEALARLGDASSPAARLVRARAQRVLGDLPGALASLEGLSDESHPARLRTRALLEGGLIAADLERWPDAARDLTVALESDPRLAQRGVLPLGRALRMSKPEELVQRFGELEKNLPRDLSSRSLLLEELALAQEALGNGDGAAATRVRRYLEEPVSPKTPTDPPAGASLTPAQLLARAEVLGAAHRNEKVVEAMAGVSEKGLTAEEICRRRFALGLAHRKLHNYRQAEEQLTWVGKRCDDDLARRALYLNAKVISIVDGLRAVPVIESFVNRFEGHTMVDDVLFWAGDLYQRRKRIREAEGFYRRIESLPTKGDHCADARWRLAWMAYIAGDLGEARTRLDRLLLEDGCAEGSFDRARAHYWRGIIESKDENSAGAVAAWERSHRQAPLGFYGQLALKRLRDQDPDRVGAMAAGLRAPAGDAVPALCPGWLADEPGFVEGIALVVQGLGSDASEELLRVARPQKKVVSKTHAVSQGVAPQQSEPTRREEVGACGAHDPDLLITLLLDKAGARRDAHWRLRTEFADVLDQLPTAETIGIFRAAYPLAFHQELEAAETEHRLPSLFLHALAREESAFDAEIVSWAGAYGLTQLLLRTGQAAGRMLKPPVKVKTAEELLDPALNARLGGAYMGSLMRRYKGDPALSLAAYNASERFANILWKRHRDHEFDRFAEEITIRETRGYVKRVLKTFGIYRWLHGGDLPELPVALRLPPVK